MDCYQIVKKENLLSCLIGRYRSLFGDVTCFENHSTKGREQAIAIGTSHVVSRNRSVPFEVEFNIKCFDCAWASAPRTRCVCVNFFVRFDQFVQDVGLSVECFFQFFRRHFCEFHKITLQDIRKVYNGIPR